MIKQKQHNLFQAYLFSSFRHLSSLSLCPRLAMPWSLDHLSFLWAAILGVDEMWRGPIHLALTRPWIWCVQQNHLIRKQYSNKFRLVGTQPNCGTVVMPIEKLPGFSCRTGYGCNSSWFIHSTKPRRALFSSKALQ